MHKILISPTSLSSASSLVIKHMDEHNISYLNRLNYSGFLRWKHTQQWDRRQLLPKARWVRTHMPSYNLPGRWYSSVLVDEVWRGVNCTPQSPPISPEIIEKSLRLETDQQWSMTLIMCFLNSMYLFLSLCSYFNMNLRECISGIPKLLPLELQNSFPPGALTTLSKQNKIAFHLRDNMLSFIKSHIIYNKRILPKTLLQEQTMYYGDVLKIQNLGSATNLALICYDSSSFVLHKIF